MASLAELTSLVVEETPPSSSACEFELFVERLLSDEEPTSGCVELTGDTCWDLPPGPLLAFSPTCGNFGLEVVLLASPFSTLLFTAGAAPAAAPAAAAADVEVVGFMLAMVLIVDAERLLELLLAFEAEAVGLMVGVTVADGFVEAGRVCLTSTSGLIGVVVVEVPATFGRGVSADWWMGFTWPIAVACLALASGTTAECCCCCCELCGPSEVLAVPALPLLATDVREADAVTEICCDDDNGGGEDSDSVDCNNGNGVRVGGAFVAAADVSDDVEADEDVIEVVVVELNEVDDEVDAAVDAAGPHVVAGREDEES